MFVLNSLASIASCGRSILSAENLRVEGCVGFILVLFLLVRIRVLGVLAVTFVVKSTPGVRGDTREGNQKDGRAESTVVVLVRVEVRGKRVDYYGPLRMVRTGSDLLNLPLWLRSSTASCRKDPPLRVPELIALKVAV